jgi:hypothetical protein
VLAEATGCSASVTTEVREESYPADLSADGKILLFDEEGGGGALDYSKSGGLSYAVYLRKTDGSPAVLLGEGAAVALSPDGKWAIAQPQGSPTQLKSLPTGVGEPKDLTHDNVNHTWARWFPDQKRILFTGNEPGKGVRLNVYELQSGKTRAISPEGVHGTAFVISPDSQTVRHRSRPKGISLYRERRGAECDQRIESRRTADSLERGWARALCLSAR